MNPEQLRKIVEDAINDANPFKWWVYLIVILLAALASFFGAYYRRRGENWATKNDFDELLKQTQKTTQATEDIKANISARSDFEKQIRRDQFATARAIHTKISRVATNIHRLKNGIKVPDLIKNGDIVPLTEVFEELENNQYLLKDRLHNILWQQSLILVNIYSSGEPSQLEQFDTQYKGLLKEFNQAMNEVFELDKFRT